MEKIKLSIIMPCFNVEGTLARALDSILMQRVAFYYEIIIVNDASTDETEKVAFSYADNYKQIKIIKNKENLKNAKSFFKGLSEARGDYFCVLDGDDYYTIDNKLQQQVDFFNSDTLNEYVGVTHRYVRVYEDETVLVDDFKWESEFNYYDFITQRTSYYHTSAYMYRNIFHGNIPGLYNEEINRGDSPRTLFHLYYSNKKIKVLNFVGSAYEYHSGGIWSGMNRTDQAKYQVKYYTYLQDIMTASFEKEGVALMISRYQEQLKYPDGNTIVFEKYSIDKYLEKLQRKANNYAFAQKDFIFRGCYYSQYIDSTCASLGQIYRIKNRHAVQTHDDEKNICIVIGKLIPKGGGIFEEIKEIIDMYKGFSITVLVTNMDEVEKETVELLENIGNVRVVCPSKDCSDKLGVLHKEMKEAAPHKAYYYTSHNDTFGQALMTRGACRNIVPFSFDHGFICGLSNPNIDYIIAKRPTDYSMLKKKFAEKLLYIPTWGKTPETKIEYIPYNKHDKLITACGAARFYKISGSESLSYIKLVLDLLTITGGKHYHFGEMPDDVVAYIENFISENGLCEDAFVNIGWVDDIADFMLKNNVDVFLEPFPIISYKLTLAMYALGIPVFAYNGHNRMSKLDIAPKNILSWSTPNEFTDILSKLDKDILCEQSKSVQEYFLDNHDVRIIQDFFMNENSISIPEEIQFTDDAIQDVCNFRHLFEEEYNDEGYSNSELLSSTLENERKLFNELISLELAYEKTSSAYNEISSLKNHIKQYIKKKIKI